MVAEIKLYELLKNHFGEKDAQVFVRLFQESLNHSVDLKKNDMVTKKDVFSLRDEMIRLRSDLIRTIYLTSLVKLIAIIASTVMLVFILKK